MKVDKKTRPNGFHWAGCNRVLKAYASGLVLGRPIGLAPFFHWPRCLSSLMRSNRLSTERFPLAPPAVFNDECFDMVN